MCNIRRPDWPDAQVRQREQSKQNDRDRDYVSSSWIHERTTEGIQDATRELYSSEAVRRLLARAS